MVTTEELKAAAEPNPTANTNAASPRILAEAAALQLAEEIFAGIEKSLLEIVPKSYPTANLQRKVSELRECFAQTPEDAARLKQCETRLRQELGLWRMALAKRDEAFSAALLRTFCENTHLQLDKEAFLALAGLYRNMPPTDSVLSKYDYVITQYFTNKREKNRRTLRCEADKLIAELHKLNTEWTGVKSNAGGAEALKVREAIAVLAQLSAEAKAHKTLKNWLHYDFFASTRLAKKDLGEIFFVPEVTAAVIVCNIVVGNHFAALCDADSAKLTEAASLFAADATANELILNQLNRTFQTLIHTSLEHDSSEIAAQERLMNLFNLMSQDEIDDITEINDTFPPNKNLDREELPAVILGVQESENTPQADLSGTDLNAGTVNSKSESPLAETPAEEENEAVAEVDAVLAELKQPSPGLEVIKAYLQTSSTRDVQELRLAPFIFDAGGSPNQVNGDARQALEKIIRAEDFARFIENGEGDLPAGFKVKLERLSADIQSLNNNLRRSMGDLGGGDESEKNWGDIEKLLYVTNSLVEAQLRMNSAVVRRNKRGEEAAEAQTAKPSVQPFEKIKVQDAPLRKPQKSAAKPKVNYLLLTVLAFVIIAAGGLYFSGFLGDGSPVVKGDFNALELTRLQNGSVLTQAKISGDTLFGAVSKEWEVLSPDQKKEKLRLLLEEGGKQGFARIVLMNNQNQIIAVASSSEIRLN